MTTVIVHSFDPVTLIGGGDLGPGDLELALKRAPTLVAADGGADAALKAGHDPVAVIGDLDSLTPEARAAIAGDRLFETLDQDFTDFDKALGGIKAPLVLAVGFLGGRVDHQLATLSTLVRPAQRACILIGAREVICHVPPRLEIAFNAGDTVSLFPMVAVTGRSVGLQWPIDGLDLTPGGRIATSNRALGHVRLDMNGPGMLMIAPRGALDAVMRAVTPSWDRPRQ